MSILDERNWQLFTDFVPKLLCESQVLPQSQWSQLCNMMAALVVLAPENRLFQTQILFIGFEI